MTVTIQQFARHLMAQSVHYYWSNKTAHCRVLPDGRIRYWTNWEGDISAEFASLENLLAKSNAYLPEAEDLAASRSASARPALAPPFSLDATESGDGYLTIDVADRASIVINASPEGIVVDVYNPSREGDPLGSTWVHASDLDEAQDDAEVQP